MRRCVKSVTLLTKSKNDILSVVLGHPNTTATLTMYTKRIAITGYKNSGKTTLKKLLSKKSTQFSFEIVDWDDDVPSDVHGVIVIYDINSHNSYSKAYSIIADLGERGILIPTLLVGNKIDNVSRKIPRSRLVEECKQLIEEIPYLLSLSDVPEALKDIQGDGIRSVHPLEISAKEGTDVSKIIVFFISEILNNVRYVDPLVV